MPGDSDASLDLQRELGVLAAKAEENRRFLELALEAERTRCRSSEEQRCLLESKLAEVTAAASEESARCARAAKQAAKEAAAREAALRAEVEALQRQVGLQSSLGVDLRRAQEASAAAESELQVVWQKLATEQEASAALQEEAHGLRQQLQQAQEYARRSVSLQAEVNTLRQQLSEVMPPDALQEELKRLQQELAAEREANTLPESSGEETVESLKRELRGMKILVGTLEGKVRTYEQRLLEHSRTCADELNTMHPTPFDDKDAAAADAETGDEIRAEPNQILAAAGYKTREAGQKTLEAGQKTLQAGSQMLSNLLAGLTPPPGPDDEECPEASGAASKRSSDDVLIF